jgi:hypothetical protein
MVQNNSKKKGLGRKKSYLDLMLMLGRCKKFSASFAITSFMFGCCSSNSVNKWVAFEATFFSKSPSLFTTVLKSRCSASGLEHSNSKANFKDFSLQ